MEFDLTRGTEVLERTPATLRALLRGLDAAWTDATEGPETWSPYIVVGHLILGERTNWVPRAQLILAQGPNRRFVPFERVPPPQPESLDDLLEQFATLRAASLKTLGGWRLTDTELALEGEHPEFGTVSLRQLLSTWVAHDLAHVAQVARVMAKQYCEAVGPWSTYLKIMNR